MRILLGGSGSTGSSLLKNILSRHPLLFSGSETSLFSKIELYHNFNKNKHRILKRFPKGLKSHSYHLYNGIDLLHDEYQQTYKSIELLIDECSDFQSFADNLFQNGLKSNSKKYWLEKTPSNSFLFKEFLESFKDSHVIHVTRNPYDTISSLINRGFDLVYSCGIYLLNNAAGLRAQNNLNFYLVKYENLINDPENTVKDLCHSIGLTYYESMLHAGNTYNIKDTKIGSWSFDETEKIKKSKRSRFENLELVERQKIVSALNSIFVSDAGMKYFDLKVRSFQKLCDILNYPWISSEKMNENTFYLKKLLIKDKAKRILKLYPTGLCYPLAIH